MKRVANALRSFGRGAGLLVGLIGLAGCHQMSREAQLERVAKDWCQTIRASQVIPVYPLTEDLQPGDIFLVQVPVDRQQDIYRNKGFLPLDNHLWRIDPQGYKAFYDHSFTPGESNVRLPGDWMRPGQSMANAWDSAPRAAFPSYAFSVSESEGINLAIPISGVPVGLNLLGAHTANGSVSLKDARTLGCDTDDLYRQLVAWVEESPSRQAFVANFAPRSDDASQNYLRVITRIYLVGAVDVQLSDARFVGGGADVAGARPVDLFLPTAPSSDANTQDAARETYLSGVGRMSAMSGTGAPTHRGGSDAALSSEELAAREAARVKAREAEIASRTTERNTANEALTKARSDADASPEGKALATARKEREDAAKDLRTKQDALDALKTRAPTASPEEIKVASDAVEAAKGVLASKDTALATATAAYAERAKTIAAAQGKLDVAQVALDRLEGFVPGGSFKFTAASARSISMSETFPAPLVIGYLAFDVPIGPLGELGRPIPTHAIIDPSSGVNIASISPRATIYKDEALMALYDAIAATAKEDKAAASLKRGLDQLARRYVPSSAYKARFDSQARSYTFTTNAPANASFSDYMQFRKERAIVLKSFEEARTSGKIILAGNDATAAQVDQIGRDLAKYSETPAERRDLDAAASALYQYMARSTPRARGVRP